MALVNPCENCKSPVDLSLVSSIAESMLSRFEKRHKALIAHVEDAETPEAEKDKLLGKMATIGTLVAEIHATADRANNMTCEPEARCVRLSFVADAFSRAMNSAAEDMRPSRAGEDPHGPPQ